MTEASQTTPEELRADNIRKMADDLERLCCAETEGKFFDYVTDSIGSIVNALRFTACALTRQDASEQEIARACCEHDEDNKGQCRCANKNVTYADWCPSVRSVAKAMRSFVAKTRLEIDSSDGGRRFDPGLSGAAREPNGGAGSIPAESALTRQGAGEEEEVETLIGLWSMRPSPKSERGMAWEDGARQGWQWGRRYALSAQVDPQKVSRIIRDASNAALFNGAGKVINPEVFDEAARAIRALYEGEGG